MTMKLPSTSIQALKKIRAVSFDLDDTFWDCEPAIVHAEDMLHRWLEQHQPEVIEKHSKDNMRELRMDMYRTHPHLVGDVTMMRKAFLQLLLAHHENCDKVVEEAFAVFYRARSQVELYEGTHELLAALQNTHKVAAITNGNADLGLIGLSDYFQDIQSASLNSAAKPASDMFDACCENLGIAASELLHVGDNPQADVVGGHNAGALTVWFNGIEAIWPEELPRADFEVKSLPELQQLLAQVD